MLFVSVVVPLLFETGSVSTPEAHCLSLAQQMGFGNLLVSGPRLHVCSTILAFYVGSIDPKSGPQDSTAGTTPTGPSPRTAFLYFFISHRACAVILT